MSCRSGEQKTKTTQDREMNFNVESGQRETTDDREMNFATVT